MTPDEARSLGRAIRAARMEAGLTQLKLAVAIGVKSPWISAWERGQSQPTAYRQATPPAVIGRDQLTAIAEALDCTIESIANRAALSARTIRTRPHPRRRPTLRPHRRRSRPRHRLHHRTHRRPRPALTSLVGGDT